MVHFFFFSSLCCATNQNLAYAKGVHFYIHLDTKQISALAALKTGSVLHLGPAYKEIMDDIDFVVKTS